MTGDAEYCAEVLVDLPSRIEDRPLTYRVPPALCARVGVGVQVVVPLGPRTAPGFILSVHPCPGSMPHRLREILDIPDPAPLFSDSLLALARRVAEGTVSTLLDAVRCLVPPEVRRGPSTPGGRAQIATLGRRERLSGRPGRRQEQIIAALAVAPRGIPVADLARLAGRSALRRLVARGVVCVEDRRSDPGNPAAPALSWERTPREPDAIAQPTLLWGDGEARIQWIVQAATTEVRRGRQVLITVPEITRAPALIARLQAAGEEAVVTYHSDLPPSQHRTTWRRIHAGDAGVVVGTRSALFAPLHRLGLIIVDDEQDPSYKAGAAPRYHGREVAMDRGGIEGIPVVFGSAAPSLETYAGVASGRVRCVRLPPTRSEQVRVVDMRAERRAGRLGLLSRPLVEAIRRHLRTGGRAALFVNRLGYARVLLCQECGHVVRCPRCDISMSYDGETRTILCRVCGHAAPAPEVCPLCRGIALRWVGAGTRRIEEILRRLFPAARTARVDREAAPVWDTLARDAAAGRIRVVVGTQLLLRARELCPSLVGIVDADAPLHLPDFRAAERAFQQFRAVLALSAAPPGPEAVVQTRVPDHPVLTALRTGEDGRVYESELKIRKEFGYPPYTHLARVIASSRDRMSARSLAARAAEIARGCGVEVLGPAPDLPSRGHPPFRVECLLRSASPAAVRDAARSALEGAPPARGSRLVVDIDPQEMH